MFSGLFRLMPFLGRKQDLSSKELSGMQEDAASSLTNQTICSGTEKDSTTWETISRNDLESSLDRESKQLPKEHRKVWSLASFRKRREFLVDEDVSNGIERNKIPALSYRRSDKPPTDYHYVGQYVESRPMNIEKSLESLTCCACTSGGSCSREDQCHCASSDGETSLYDSKGRLSRDYNFNAPQAIYECNQLCPCNKRSCQNMVIQNGCKFKMVLFRTKSRGWGVRTMEDIKRGTFVGVYSGELVSGEDSLRRPDDTYLFNLSTSDIHVPKNRPPPPPSSSSENAAEQEGGMESSNNNQAQEQTGNGRYDYYEQYVCDAKNYGNITRFINHSCEPNVVGIRSFTEHRDSRFPYIAFFTNRDIPANTELTLNYGDNYWNIKCKRDKIFCLCKKLSCRFNKKTYPKTRLQYDRAREQSNRNNHPEELHQQSDDQQ